MESNAYIYQQGPITFLFYMLGRLGGEAVFAFFILSGFLVGGPGLERIKNGTFILRSYTIERSVRIMLPLVAAIVLYITVALCIGGEKKFIGEGLPEIYCLSSVFVVNH